jgi:ubiquinone/menaquinone biosynthesis C-methylase UbiE
MFQDPYHNVIEFGFIPGNTVVDLGAGAGFYTAALSRVVGSTGTVVAVDIQEEPLIRLKRTALEEGKSNIEVLVGDIEEDHGTRLKNGAADGAVFSHTLSKLPNKQRAIQEAKRIVRPGGRVCVVEWRNKANKVNEKELFEAAGLTFEREFDAGDGHYGLIFKKNRGNIN